MTGLILPLDSPDATLEVAGGKGAGLAALVRRGFPVPPGFIITTAAYRAFVATGRLEQDIAEAAATDLAARFLEAPLADDVAAAILCAHRELAAGAEHGDRWSAPGGRPPLAVRSSATAEDLPTASFAGQQESFLNICGDEQLLAAVRRCWASLWNPRAMAYRHRLGLAGDQVAMAVVVQVLVPAERSGVMFTIDPVAGDDSVVVINAAWGLGDAVVAGRVMPDTVVVDKATGREVRRHRGRQAVMTVPSDTGVVDVEVDAGRAGQDCLDAGDAAALALLGQAIEDAFDGPQDVEWAGVNGRFYLVQARPVTASGGGPPGDDWPALDERPPEPFDVWTLANVGEVWPEPVSPLVASVVPLVISGAVRSSLRGVNQQRLDRIQWAKRFYGRVYYNEGALKQVLTQELGLPASLLDRSRGNRHVTPGGDRLHPLRLAWNLPIILRLVARQRQVGHETEAFLPRADGWVAEFRARPGISGSDQQLWDESQVWFERMRLGLNLQNEMSGLALATLGTLESLLTRWVEGPDLATALVAGVGEIQAAQMGAALARLADSVRDLGLTAMLDDEPKAALARLRAEPGAGPVLERLEEFLTGHGHRCANEAEWLHPRWHEAPEQVLSLAAAYLRPGVEDPDERVRRQRERRRQAAALVEAKVGPVRRTIIRRVVARGQYALRLRDNGKGAAMKASYPARHIAVVLGRRWVDRGWLVQPDDIFFLTHPEIEQIIAAGDPQKVTMGGGGLDLRSTIAARRRARDYWGSASFPDVLGPDGKPLATEDGAPVGGRRLQGIPASSGRARGTARVLLDAQDLAQLRPSDILVTRTTDAGWTVAFPLIGGLVTEIGGQLSHAAIVAREYGLAAVVDVAGATSAIRDGQTILVDGNAGTVDLEDGDPGERGRPGPG